MSNMDNPNQGDAERLIAGTRKNIETEKQSDEKDRFTDDNPLPEEQKTQSEAYKEAETKPEDFESFNTEKIEDLEEAKAKSNLPEEEKN